MPETPVHHATARPIFIVGPGRSGTTLLRSLLSAHPAIAVTPETQYMKWADRRGDLAGAPRDFDRFWSEYTSWVRFADLAIDPDECLDLIRQQGRPTFETIFRAVLAVYGRTNGVERVGEKSPSHVHYIDDLVRWFPGATVLILQRDPRAIIASQLKTPYVRSRIRSPSLREGLVAEGRTHQIVHFAKEWVEIYGRIVPRWKADERVGVVSYEALVRDPEEVLRALCERIDEDFEPAMISEQERGKVAPPAGVTPNADLERWRREHHARSRAPISDGSLDKWRSELSATDVALIEGYCGEVMEAMGYRPESSIMHRRSAMTGFGLLRLARAAEGTTRRVLRGSTRPFRVLMGSAGGARAAP